MTEKLIPNVTVNIAYLNIRKLGDGPMRAIKLDLLEQQIGRLPEVMLLSETKCETKLAINGTEVYQTQPSNRGRVVAQFRVP